MADEKPFPPQSQSQPGREHAMEPPPLPVRRDYRGSGKLDSKAAIITGGDSGIGRAVAVLFAREGCDCAIVYLEENDDAAETRRLVEAEGRRCVAIRGDLGDPAFCAEVSERALADLGRIDILVNNAAEQHDIQDRCGRR